jgi:DNA-binding CsgD family transcriptional regulator
MYDDVERSIFRKQRDWKNGAMVQSAQTVLGEIIGAIGEPDFPSVAALELQRLTRFDLAAIVLHQRSRGSTVIFDDFDTIGCRSGIETYARQTHRINPMLRASERGVVRARDFARKRLDITSALQSHIVPAPDEELGYRTIGWPTNHEEIGLYFEGWGGLVEFGLYRERSRKAASARMFSVLQNLRSPIAAAFERHGKFVATARPGNWAKVLSRREKEVCHLLLAGCASDAIALRLRISRHTVKDHRKNIFRKLQIASLAELFALAR